MIALKYVKGFQNKKVYFEVSLPHLLLATIGPSSQYRNLFVHLASFIFFMQMQMYILTSLHFLPQKVTFYVLLPAACFFHLDPGNLLYAIQSSI